MKPKPIEVWHLGTYHSTVLGCKEAGALTGLHPTTVNKLIISGRWTKDGWAFYREVASHTKYLVDGEPMCMADICQLLDTSGDKVYEAIRHGTLLHGRRITYVEREG